MPTNASLAEVLHLKRRPMPALGWHKALKGAACTSDAEEWPFLAFHGTKPDDAARRTAAHILPTSRRCVSAPISTIPLPQYLLRRRSMTFPYRTLSTPVTQGYVSWGSLPNDMHLHCTDTAARREPSHAALEKTDRVKFDISIMIGRSGVERNKFVLQRRRGYPAFPRLYSSSGIRWQRFKTPP